MAMTAKQRLDAHDKQIAAIRDLVREGMRLVIETRKDIRALAQAQRKTEANLQALIDSLGKTNGKGKR
jgi:Arc/MetJ-type ribon-helix-helix transcriptional regulator